LDLESEGDDEVEKDSKNDIEMGLLTGSKLKLKSDPLDEMKFSFIDESARESARSARNARIISDESAKESAHSARNVRIISDESAKESARGKSDEVEKIAKESASSKSAEVRLASAKNPAINYSEPSNAQQNGKLKKSGADPKA